MPQRIVEEVTGAIYTFSGLAVAKALAWIDWHGITDALLKSMAWAVGGFIITHAIPYAVKKWRERKGK